MLRLSRRQLLKTTAISTALAATPQSVLAASREKLTIPPLMEAKRGRPIILNMEETGYKLDGSHSVSVWGFNGNYLGPTIRIKSGSFAKLNYHNNLPQSIALSIQGLQASGELFGGAAKVLKKGESWGIYMEQMLWLSLIQMQLLLQEFLQNMQNSIRLLS